MEEALYLAELSLSLLVLLYVMISIAGVFLDCFIARRLESKPDRGSRTDPVLSAIRRLAIRRPAAKRQPARRAA